MRLEITAYDAVLFDESAENTGGTCYTGGVATTPCHTIGLFHPSTGVAKPPAEQAEYSAGLAYQGTWQYFNARYQANGADVGSAQPDIFF